MKDVGDKMNGRGSVGVVVWESKTEFQDRVSVVAFISEFVKQIRYRLGHDRAHPGE